MGKKRTYDDDDDVEEDLEDDDAAAGLEDSEDAGGSDGEGPSRKKKRRGASFIDEAAEEDDEDDDDDDEGDKQKKKGRSVFIDDIADVDDEDEEEEVEEDAEDLIDDRDVEIPDAAAAPLNYRRITREEDNAREEDILRRIEERYRDYAGEDIPDTAETGVVGQQGLLPTPNDPKLWLVTCKAGHEREAVVQLLQKSYTMAERGAPLRILSAVALDHLPGFIYVEAAKESHVMDAIRGLRTVYVGKGAKLVPLNEMVDAVTVNKKAKDDMARDTWVRVRGGLYKDDLARVVDVDPVAGRATIKLLHRLDFAAMVNRTEEQRKKNPFGRAPTVRPIPKVFNPEEARVAGLLVQRLPAQDGMPSYQVLSHTFVGGYLLRRVGMKTLIVLDTLPGLEEVARFNAGATTGDDDAPATDLSSLMATLPTDGTSAHKGTFMKGDKARTGARGLGDLENLTARVTGLTADGAKVTAIPDIKGFAEEVEFEPDELTKVFSVGQRVRVLAGQYAGDTGMVVRVEEALCYLISDTNREEIKVFARDLTESEVVAAGIEMLGEYQLHDLVQINQNTAGVVVKIEKDAARVLTNNGTPEQPDVRLYRLTDIQRKVTFKQKPVTQDQAGNPLREKDYVVIQSGRLKDRGGSVVYIWRGTLFLHCKEITENGGYVAVRSFSTRLRGASSGGGAGGSLNSARASAILGGGTPGSIRSTPGSVGPSPGGSAYGGGGSYHRYTPASPRPDDPSSSGGGIGADGKFQMSLPQRGGSYGGGRGGGGGGAGGGSYSRRSQQAQPHSQYVGKVVRVVKGPYNGYRGRVKQQTATHVQLELDAVAGRPVTVPMEYVTLGEAPKSGTAAAVVTAGYRAGAGGYGAAAGRGGDGRWGADGQPPQTPAHPGMQTPAHYSMTPAHPSMTPAHAPYTPAHAPYTPAHHTSGENDGYWGDGGSRHQPMTAPTPGYGGTAPTPQQQAMTPALTPQGFTPQEAMHAPTPADLHLHPHGVAGTCLLGLENCAVGGVRGVGTVMTLAVVDEDGDGGTPNLAPTPGLARTPYLAAPTPGVDAAPTPGGAPYDAGGYTPGTHAATGTPGLTAPTPGMPTAYTPAFTPSGHIYTPGTPGGLDVGTPAVLGIMEDFGTWGGILVQTPDGRSCVVRTAQPDGTLSLQPGVYSPDAGFTLDAGAPRETHDARTLTVVRPSKRDKVKVIKAETQDVLGVTGTLIGIDNADGIVKCDLCVLDLADVSGTRGGQGTRLCHLLADESLLRRLSGNTGEDCVSALRSLNLPDSFWTDEFKVVPCSKTYAHKWTLCPCAHIGETARRRCPRTVNYKAVLCPLVKAKKTCPLGEGCTYAHNVFEHWLHPSRYKTRLCSFGRNCNRSICFFAHSAEELRCVPCVDDKEGDDREYLVQLLMAQENGLMQASTLESVPPAPMPPLLPTIMPDLSAALQQALQQPLPPSARTSVNGLSDAAAIMSARQSMNGLSVSELMSARPSLSGLPGDPSAAMLRASMSGAPDAHGPGNMLLRARPSMNGLSDRTTTAFASARASMNGLPDGAFARARPSLNGLSENNAATAASMLLSMQRAVSTEINSALNAATMQRGMSSELGVMGGAAGMGMAMGMGMNMAAPFHAAAMQHALSGDLPSAHLNAAAVAMERAFSRELNTGGTVGGTAGSISPVQPSAEAAAAAALERAFPGMQSQLPPQQRELVGPASHRRDLSSLNPTQSINSVESDSLIQLRHGPMGGVGTGGGTTGAAVLGGYGACGAFGFEAALGGPQPPARISDPGSNFHMALPSGMAGMAASHARVSDSGNKLGMICSKDLQNLESLLPLMNNALASGALALPMAASGDNMRRSNSGGSNSSGRLLSPSMQDHISSGSPSHSGTLTPLSSKSVEAGSAEGAGGGAVSATATASGNTSSPSRTFEGTAALKGMYMAAMAAASAGCGSGIHPNGATNFALHQAPSGSGADQAYLNGLVAQLQDQGVNKDQLVSSEQCVELFMRRSYAVFLQIYAAGFRRH
ncbi:hypothetical protein VOLCADRAFT_106802 [Volvox carteri f. nagariensis]|uniref:Transcription elongation factor SPT5 n=1 Tax=Volvox carteri f. nagariensis TaxID=3068 RepID=D8U9U3_VOLCA|nr:uncharacterized protein VOLCADRAFT_106802 [Volvox carteri f. nagariensis]EFJ43471.1 hypothetical protein VOLCADRAFT_106802 [Volvox carteri f. nagariensis]|eukprot:XP_002955400.1 hypothetical protein VOLCADRAFT_106802 [Volvox carteri f. nagariensis]